MSLGLNDEFGWPFSLLNGPRWSEQRVATRTGVENQAVFESDLTVWCLFDFKVCKRFCCPRGFLFEVVNHQPKAHFFRLIQNKYNKYTPSSSGRGSRPGTSLEVVASLVRP